jgi:hypothetical protein
MPQRTWPLYSSSFFPATSPAYSLPKHCRAETRRAIIAGMRTHSVRINHKTSVLRNSEEDDEF